MPDFPRWTEKINFKYLGQPIPDPMPWLDLQRFGLLLGSGGYSASFGWVDGYLVAIGRRLGTGCSARWCRAIIVRH